ncbi:hypothetical protein EV426DRAFT_99238 [Tirmania nivea]|nr:hypothetical protein EV426DRAFT_99238 [Tirmania nivea]
MLIKNTSVLVLAAVELAFEVVVADMPSSSRASIERRQFGSNRFGGNQRRQTGGNNGQNGSGNKGKNGGKDGGNNGGNADLTLDPANVQTGSQANGQNNGQSAPGQSPSLTDNANFINFCTGKTLTNGQQNRGGSCNGVVMGDLPAASQMISTIIISPQPGQNIAANTEFKVVLQVANLEAGSFTNPDSTYYTAPQTLKNGRVVGHTHVTIQDLGGSLAPTRPPNAETFAFFKGINDDGNGNGQLQAVVANGLAAGFYRLCTINSASNHQPVIMPVAQRGAQDDCVRFTVGQKQGGGGGRGRLMFFRAA